MKHYLNLYPVIEKDVKYEFYFLFLNLKISKKFKLGIINEAKIFTFSPNRHGLHADIPDINVTAFNR